MHVERYQWFLMIKFPYFSASRSKASIAFLSSNSSPTFESPTPTPFQDTKSDTLFRYHTLLSFIRLYIGRRIDDVMAKCCGCRVQEEIRWRYKYLRAFDEDAHDASLASNVTIGGRHVRLGDILKQIPHFSYNALKGYLARCLNTKIPFKLRL